MDRIETFDKTTQQMLDEAKKLSPEAIAQILRDLNAAHDEVVARIARSTARSYGQAQLANMQQQIEQTMAYFARQAGVTLNDSQKKAFDLGSEIVDRPHAAAGSYPLLGAISRIQLEVNQAYTLTKLQNVSAEAVARINDLLHRVFMGGTSIQEVERRIGAELLGGGEVPSFFSAAGKRAALITHNEIHRMQNLGAQARLQSLAQRAIDRGDKSTIGKEWRHTLAPDMSPRPGHVKLNGTVIPVKEKFVDEVTGDELLFPGDPDADESATTGCKCYLLPAFL
jgi:F like protein